VTFDRAGRDSGDYTLAYVLVAGSVRCVTRALAVVIGIGTAITLTPSAGIGQAEPLRVEVSGVNGDAERNVRTVLQIARAADTGKVPLERIRNLHDKAPADIQLALEPFGLYRSTVRSSLRKEGDTWVARYAIQPGPAVLVRTVDLRVTGAGAKTPAFQKLVRDFPLHPGDTLLHLPYEAAKLAFLTVATDSGYLDAKFDTADIRVDRAASTADVQLHFDTGPRFKFGPVSFEQDVLDPRFLETRVSFKRGEPYRGDKLLELQTALGQDPYFRRIEVIPRRDLARGVEVPIEVQLEPRKPRGYEVGAGYGTDTGPRGSFAVEWRRLNRRGHSAKAEITVSPVEQSISTEYRIPAVGSPTGMLTFMAGYALFNPTVSNSKTILVGTRLGRQRFRWNEVLSLTYHHEAFRVGVDSGTTDMIIGGASWERVRANDQVFPSKGWRVRLSLQGSPGGLASPSLGQIEALAKLIHPIARNTRVLLRANVGRTFSSNFRSLPPTLRFFAGGTETVRGFGYLELGPPDSLGHVIGGPVLEVASVELDHKIFNRWAVAAFTDVGNALNSFTLSVKQGALEQGVGAGIRWVSPIGLVRIDGAFAVTRPGTPFHLHFSVGPDL
jgi:translocation and assembly module TamA